MIELSVQTAGGVTPVLIGPGVSQRVAEHAPPEAERCALVADPTPAALHVEGLRAHLGDHDLFLLEPGEENKEPSNLAALWSGLAKAGIHRGDWIVAFGGGVTTDVAGFAAATYHRGIDVVNVPTTLLGQVDAAIGGKTAVDLPEGKNLVGAFHQPRAVLCDTSLLATLPAPVFATGLAECIKHALIADPGLLDDARGMTAGAEPDRLAAFVARSAAVKIDLVSRDPNDRGDRAYLNYGHTLAHALEAHGAYSMSHGQAVAIGMMFAAHLAAALGHHDLTGLHRMALTAAGLPTAGAGAPYAEIRELWMRDKKYQRGMRFVLLRDVAQPYLASDLPEDALNLAYERVR